MLFRGSIAIWLITLAVMLAGGPLAGETGRLSSDPANRLSTVPHDPEMERAVLNSALPMITVKHEGWRETLASFSRLKVHELTGRRSLPRQAPEYTVLSMIFENDLWLEARIFPIEHPDLLEMLGAQDKWVSWREVAENPNIDMLLDEVRNLQPMREELERLTKLLNVIEQTRKLGTDMRVVSMYQHEGIEAEEVLAALENRELHQELHLRRDELRSELRSQRPLTRATERLLMRVRLLSDLPAQFLIVPDTESVDNRWVRPIGMTHNAGLMAAGREFDRTLAQAFETNNPENLAPATERFLNLAERSRHYPDQRFRSMKNFYVTSNPWRWASLAYFLTASLFGLFLFFKKNSYYWAGLSLLGLGFVVHSVAVIVRGYLTGHVPVSNMYESITFTSWAVMLIALGVEGWTRKGIVGGASAGIGFMFLIGAGLMPLHETRIHPLRAVLNSYWLNIHVTMMLLSYAAFAIAAFFAGLYLVRYFLGREALFGSKPVMDQVQTEEFAYRLVQLGWPLLTFGIALGAVWADTAWGRFWGWDPKETWAFITWVGYTVFLHMRMVMGWRGSRSAAACVIGFVLVLITWLGVSYIPLFAGGLHSYASPNTF